MTPTPRPRPNPAPGLRGSPCAAGSRRMAGGLMLVIAAAFASVPAAAKEPGQPAITWEETPEATLETNLEAWRAALEASEGESTAAAYRLSRRKLHLLEAIEARFDLAPQVAAQHTLEQARTLAELGLENEACAHLKRWIEQAPDQPEAVAEALSAILGLADTPTAGKQWSHRKWRWTHFAWRRLVALDRAGLLGDPQALQRGYEKRHETLLQTRVFDEIGLLLRAYEARFGRDAWWLEAAVTAMVNAGHRAQANRFLDAHAPASQSQRYDTWVDSLVTVASDADLEARWEEAVKPHTPARELAATLAADAGGGLLVEVAPGHHRPQRAQVLDRLPETEPRRYRQTAELQEAQRGAEVSRAAEAGDWPRVLALARQAPWAASSHQALVAYGEAKLAAGRYGEGLRAFRDVLERSEDESLQGRAAAGWMLAAVSARRGAALEGALEAILERLPEGLACIVAGEKKTPAAFADELLEADWRGAGDPGAEARRGQRGAEPAGALEKLRLPPVPFEAPGAWYHPGRLEGGGRSVTPPPKLPPRMSLRAAGARAIAAWPLGLAALAPGDGEPAWSRRIPASGEAGMKWPRPLPRPFTPWIAGERIYTRWRLDAGRRQYLAVACLDARTGHRIWSTEDHPALSGLLPVSDPVAHEGGVYLLAARRGNPRKAALVLLRLSARDGSLVWQQPLGTADAALRNFSHMPWSAPVTVRGGAVYFATSTGLLGKCDIRDGMRLWLRTYPRPNIEHEPNAVYPPGDSGSVYYEHLARRPGSAPMLAGGRVIFAPRDFLGVKAFDAETGEPAWDAPLLPSDRIVGEHAGRVILGASTHLIAVEAATGELAWARRLTVASPELPHVAMHGAVIDVLTTHLAPGASEPARRLVRLRAEDGTTVDEARLAGHAALHAFAAAGPDRFAVVEGAGGLQAPGQSSPGAEPAADFTPDPQAPFARVWELARPGARLLAPPALPLDELEALSADRDHLATHRSSDPAAAPDHVLLYRQGVLEALPVTGEGRRWQALVPPHFQGPFLAGEAIVFIDSHRLLRIDAASGERLEIEMPFNLRASNRMASRHHARGYLMAVAEGRYIAFAGLHRVGVFDAETDTLKTIRLPSHSPFFRIFNLDWEAGKIHTWFAAHEHYGHWARRFILDPGQLTIAEAGRRRGWDGAHANRVQQQVNRDRAERIRAAVRGIPADPEAGEPAAAYTWDREALTLTRRREAGGQTTAFTLPAEWAAKWDRIEQVDFRERDGALEMMLRTGGNGRRRLHIHTFSPSGESRRAEVLPASLAGARITWRGDHLVARKAGIVSVYARGRGGLKPPPTAELPAAPEPLAIDAELADWSEAPAADLDGADAGTTLHLARDPKHLYLALRHPERRARAKTEPGRFAAGNWLELEFDGRHWLALGRTPGGTSRVERSAEAPGGVRGALRHELAAGAMVYELAIPSRPKVLRVRAWRTGENGHPSIVFEWMKRIAPEIREEPEP